VPVLVGLHIIFTSIVTVLVWCLAVLVCGRFGVWPFWFKAVLDVTRCLPHLSLLNQDQRTSKS